MTNNIVMEAPIKNVSLSFCCKEDWNGFSTIDERTRFCASCKHKVIDFTQADKATFEGALQSGERVCGRFKASQMSESFLKVAAATLIVAASTTACTKENIEARPLPIPVEVKTEEMEDIELMGDVVLGIVLEVEKDSTLIRVDTLRNEK